MASAPSPKSDTNLVEVASFLFLLAVILGVVFPTYGQMVNLRKQRVYLSRCRTNLLTLQERLEAYAREHDKAYPRELPNLVGPKLAALPTCPAAGIVTYQDKGYQVRNLGVSRYTLLCWGNNHQSVGLNLNEPFYSSVFGLGPLSAPTEEWTRLQGCKANLEQLGSAVRQLDAPPPTLQALVDAGKVAEIPKCPSAGSPTYLEGYTVEGTAFTIACHGSHHADAGKRADEPYYSSNYGLGL